MAALRRGPGAWRCRSSGPELFFPDFELDLPADELAAIGLEDVSTADVYVTVRATPNPLETTANLRAPLVIHGGRGYQVLNAADGRRAAGAAVRARGAAEAASAPADAA